MKGLRTRLAQGAALAFLVNGAGVGLALLSQLAAAQLLGIESYGVFSFVLAWVMLLAAAANLGFEMALVRFASPYYEARDLGNLRGLIGFAEKRVLAVGLAVVAIGALVLGLGPDSSTSDELGSTFLLGLVAVPLIALMRVRLATVRSFGRVAQALIPDKVVRESVFIGLLLILALTQPWLLTAPAAAGALTIGAAVSLIMITYSTRHAAPHGLKSTAPQIRRAPDLATDDLAPLAAFAEPARDAADRCDRAWGVDRDRGVRDLFRVLCRRSSGRVSPRGGQLPVHADDRRPVRA